MLARPPVGELLGIGSTPDAPHPLDQVIDTQADVFDSFGLRAQILAELLDLVDVHSDERGHGHSLPFPTVSRVSDFNYREDTWLCSLAL